MPNGNTWRHIVPLFFLCAAVYALFTHGGIRSPDSEVAFRTAEALALRGTFALEGYLDQWPGFGMAPGRDGRLYSRYQPLQPLLLAPFARAAEAMRACPVARWFLRPVPGSHYVNADPRVIRGQTPADPGPHLVRALVMPFAILVSALQAVVFWMLILRLGGSARAAWAGAAVFAFGTLNLSYAGTLFKEPLVGLLTLSALLPLFPAGAARGSPGLGAGALVLSGLLAGLAVAAHLLAVSIVPFVALFAALQAYAGQGRRGFAAGAALWVLGLLPVLALLGWHNFDRFGHALDTGFRASAAEMGQRRFLAPWVGMSGLLFSAGKGLLFYCPAAVAGALCWRRLHAARPALSWTLAALVLARIVFVGSFVDWHGGFCLGPRYLVNVVPFMLLPLCLRIDDALRRPRPWAAAALLALAWLAVCQQVYFAMGEIFGYMHGVRWRGMAAGFDVFKDGYIYFSWRASPLLHILEGGRGPFLLRKAPLPDGALLALLCAAFLPLVGLAASRPPRERRKAQG
ncbi:MAG: hypothetical protein FJ225_10325 [Lentisphaerae bacterium]|nr:hypothetical protein [Lentisphaerota bacterium]